VAKVKLNRRCNRCGDSWQGSSTGFDMRADHLEAAGYVEGEYGARRRWSIASGSGGRWRSAQAALADEKARALLCGGSRTKREASFRFGGFGIISRQEYIGGRRIESQWAVIRESP